MILPQEIENIRSQIKDKIAESGAELLEIQYRKMGAQRSVITFIVDKEDGINLQECVDINRRLSDYFDELSSVVGNTSGDYGALICPERRAASKDSRPGNGWIEGSYYLEVNSPGLDRPLVTERDFIRTAGQTLRITQRETSGVLKTNLGRVRSVKDGNLSFEVEGKGGVIELPLSGVVKALREIRFNK